MARALAGVRTIARVAFALASLAVLGASSYRPAGETVRLGIEPGSAYSTPPAGMGGSVLFPVALPVPLVLPKTPRRAKPPRTILMSPMSRSTPAGGG